MAKVPSVGFTNLPPERAEMPGPSLVQEAQDALLTENPIVSPISDHLNVLRTEADPSFNVDAAIRELPSRYNTYIDALAFSNSREEFNSGVAQIDRRLAARKRLANGGLSATAMQFGAAVLSPTNAIPIGGAAVGALRGAARVGAAAAGAAAIDEAILQASSPVRTREESLFAVGGAAVLGAGLGAAMGRMNKGLIDRAIDDFKAAPSTDTVEEQVAAARAGAGAERASPLRGSGAGVKEAGGFGIVDRTAEALNPAVATVQENVRAGEDGLRTAMDAFENMAATGRDFEGAELLDDVSDNELELHKAVSPGGTAEGISRAAEAKFQSRGMQIFIKAFSKYRRGKEGTVAGSEFTAIIDQIVGPRDGKLSYQEFSEEVYLAMANGDESPRGIPEATEAAQELRQRVVEPIAQELERTRLLNDALRDQALEASQVKSYVHEIYNHALLRQRRQEFIETYVRHNVAARRQELLDVESGAEARAGFEEQRAADLELSGEDAARRLEELDQQEAELSSGPGARALADIDRLDKQRKALREEAKTASPDAARRLEEEAATLKQRIRDVKKANPEAEAVKQKKREVRKLRQNLISNRVDKRLESIAKARAKIANDEASVLARNERFAEKYRKLRDRLGNLSEDAIKERLDRLGQQMVRAEETSAKAEARLARLHSQHPELIEEIDSFQFSTKDSLQTILDDAGVAYERADNGELLLDLTDDIRDQIVRGVDRAIVQGRMPDGTPLTNEMQQVLSRARQDIASARTSEQLEAVFDQMARENAKFARSQKRLGRLMREVSQLDEVDVEEARNLLAQAIDSANRQAARQNARAALRAQSLSEKIARLDPDTVSGLPDELRARAQAIREEANEKIEQATTRLGAERLDPTKELRDEASRLVDRILSNPDGDILSIAVEERGPALRRTLNIPFKEKKDFLIRDFSRVLSSMVRKTIPDTVMKRKFGDVGGKDVARQIAEEAQAKIDDITQDEALTAAEKNQRVADITKRRAAALNRWDILVGRLRHKHGTLQNPESMFNRVGMGLLRFGTARLLGSTLLASFPELAQGTMRFGWTTPNGVWAHVQKSFDPDFIKEFNQFAEEIGAGQDIILNSRHLALTELDEIQPSITLFERVLEDVSNFTSTISLQKYYNSTFQTLFAGVARGQIMNAIETIMGTQRLMNVPHAKRIIASAGIDGPMLERIWGQLKEQGVREGLEAGALPRSKGVGASIRPDLGSWADQDAADTIRAWAKQQVDSIIVTPGIADKPIALAGEVDSETARLLTSDGTMAAKMLFHVRSFTMAATGKILAAGLARRDQSALLALTQMMALSIVSYMAWAASFGFDSAQWEEATSGDGRNLLDNAVARSGVLGIFDEARNYFSNSAVTHRFVNFSDDGVEGKVFQADWLEKIFGVQGSNLVLLSDLITLSTHDPETLAPTGRTINEARKAIPYQNLFYIRWLLDQVEESAKERIDEG